jgi:RsiW-degrading membrane proteinase PrsW (M82 family)
MSGTWIMIVLILVSSIPVIAVFVWFRIAKYQYSLTKFLFTLLAGAAAFLPAIILQDLLSFSIHDNRAAFFYEIFIRIALTEELSRLLIMIIFLWAAKRLGSQIITEPLSLNAVKMATAAGLVAGLGFALLENAINASADINILILRIFTAALHGACGGRIGAAAVMLRTNPVQALLRIMTAVAIHGVYNFTVIRPGLPSIAAILIAVSALATTIMTIRGGWTETLPSKPAIDKTTETL